MRYSTTGTLTGVRAREKDRAGGRMSVARTKGA
jgi:hypothetical protein